MLLHIYSTSKKFTRYGHAIILTENLSFRSISGVKLRKEDDTAYMLEVNLSEDTRFTEIHDDKEIAIERIRAILKAYGYGSTSTETIVDNFKFNK